MNDISGGYRYNMCLNEFIDELLPGDLARGVPAFSHMAGERLQRLYPELCAQMEVALTSLNLAPASSLEMRISALNAFSAATFAEFRDVILGLYFSTSAVLNAMGETSEPLFPRGQTLPPIDFELLTQVYERGCRWRSTEESGL